MTEGTRGEKGYVDGPNEYNKCLYTHGLIPHCDEGGKNGRPTAKCSYKSDTPHNPPA